MSRLGLPLLIFAFGTLALGGCANSAGAPPTPGNAAESTSARRSQAIGVYPGAPKDLFISDSSTESVDIFSNGTYAPAGTITSGLKEPDGTWIDAAGNLYVANVTAQKVTEYAPGATKPTCTYETDLVSPIRVVTDSAENVYVLDSHANNAPGYVRVYSQCGSLTTSLDLGGIGWGIALDSADNLFVRTTRKRDTRFSRSSRPARPRQLNSESRSPTSLPASPSIKMRT
jgi:hypothetical protein